MLQQNIVEFHGRQFLLVKDGNTVYVSLSSLCNALEIEEKSQRAKAKKNSIRFGLKILPVVGPNGKERDALCLALNSLNIWATTIDLSKITGRARTNMLHKIKFDFASTFQDHFESIDVRIEELRKDLAVLRGSYKRVLFQIRDICVKEEARLW